MRRVITMTRETLVKAKCWGTRGSVPVSGAAYARHGGATTCFELQLTSPDPNTPERVIIDCGTGMAHLGRAHAADCKSALILQTHMHWDHIQGFPFFAPLFMPDASFDFWGVEREGQGLREVLDGQMSGPMFPVGMDILASRLRFDSLPEEGSLRRGELEIAWTELIHPSGSTGYRFNIGGLALVFTGDVEVQQGCAEKLAGFAQGADVLIMDAQYFPEEYPYRVGFGHSTPIDAIEVALAAGVKHLIMTHHDPGHDDARLEQKLELARAYADGRLLVSNAYDGLEFDLGAHHTATSGPAPLPEIVCA